MKFQIMHESKGRVRLRAVQNRMSIEQADLLEAFPTVPFPARSPAAVNMWMPLSVIPQVQYLLNVTAE